MREMKILLFTVTAVLVEYTLADELGTQFWLYTNLGDRELLDPYNMTNSFFDPCNQTIVLVTGYNQRRSDKRLTETAQLMANKFYNVILVDFDSSDYYESVINAGTDIANFLRDMERLQNLTRKEVNLWGVSMGTHVAAYASSLFKVGRLTAADPSGPYYDLAGRSVRLDRSDADFVEVISSSKLLDGGSLRNFVGHVNFIINGGSDQPGCNGNSFCNHVRSAYVYKASFEKCRFVFRRCFAYWAFKIGLCDRNPTLEFGTILDPTTAPRLADLYFYDVSRSEYPYCAEEDEIEPTFNTRFCES